MSKPLVTLVCPMCGRETRQQEGVNVSCMGLLKSEDSVGHKLIRMRPKGKQ